MESLCTKSFTRRAVLEQAAGICLTGGAAALLTGCKPSAQPAPPVSCDTKPGAARKKSWSGQAQINWLSELGDNGLYTHLAQLFNQTNSDIQVTQSTLQDHDLLIQAIQHENSPELRPDVFALDTVWVDEFVSKGLLAPLCDRWPATERSQYYPEPMQAATVNSEVYAAPFRTDIGLLYCRTDIVQQLPKTWDELFEQAQQAQANQPGVTGYIWQGAPFEGLTCNFTEILHSYGGTFDPHNVESISSVEAQEALTQMIRWIGTITPRNVLNIQEDGSSSIWNSGQAAFMRDWPEDLPISSDANRPFKGHFTIRPIPHGGRAKVGHSCTGGWFLGINPHSPHQDAAWEFVHWMMQEEAQRITAYKNYWLVTRKSVYDNPDIQARNPFFIAIRDLGIIQNAQPRPRSAHYQTISTAMRTHIHQALLYAANAKQQLSTRALQQLAQQTLRAIQRDLQTIV